MDKKYRKHTLKLVLLLLCVSVFGCGILTVQKANWIISDYSRLICDEEIPSVDVRMTYETAGDIEAAFYLGWDKCLPHIADDIGFYTALKNSKGETLAHYQPYVVVSKYLPKEQGYDRRILLLGDEFYDEYGDLYYTNSEDEDFHKAEALNALDMYANVIGDGLIKGIEIDGTCDDKFIYLEKLKWYDSFGSYEFSPSKKQEQKGNETFKEWYKDSFDPTRDHISTQNLWYLNSNNGKYNDEAKLLCEQVAEDYINNITLDVSHIEHEGYFTYYIQAIGYVNQEYFFPCVYVFHPIQIAIKELVGVYVAVMSFAVVAIVIMCIVMRNSYEKQKAAENNRRELTRGIAHELKTPLAITRGYVENWEYLPEEDKEEITQTMMQEMDHMNKMVTDLLELSHMEAGIKAVQWEEVDLYSLTESILRRMRNIISERNLDVKMVPSDIENTDGFVVSADLEMIRIAMSNFISNAVKYAEKEVTITLTQSNKKVSFVIENDGNTIDDEEIKKVWDEFYKSDSVNRSTIGSSGLGLAITKNIFILHNAEYGCGSENGKISFFFEIKKKQ